MAISSSPVQQSASTAFAGSKATAYGHATTGGNLLVAAIGHQGGVVVSVTDDAGNTWIQGPETLSSGATAQRFVGIWYCPNAFSTTTVTVTGTGTNVLNINLTEWSGVSTTAPVYAMTTGLGVQTAPIPAGVVAASGDLVFGVLAYQEAVAGTALDTLGGGFTALTPQNQSTTRLSAAYNVTSSAGITAPAWTMSAATSTGRATIIFRSASNTASPFVQVMGMGVTSNKLDNNVTLVNAPANSRVLALVTAKGRTSTTDIATTSCSGGSLTWTRRALSSQAGGGQNSTSAEIWEAWNTTAQNLTITIVPSSQDTGSTSYEISVLPVAIVGDEGSSFSGATTTGNSASGIPSLSLTTAANSLIFATAADGASAGVGTSNTGQSLIYDANDSQYSYHIWQTNAPVSSGSNTISLTAPSGQQYNATALEIKAASSGPVTVNGAASIASITTLADSAFITTNVASAINAISALLSSVVDTHFGAATINSITSLTSAGAITLSGAANVQAISSLLSTASNTVLPSSTIHSISGLNANFTQTLLTNSTISSVSSLISSAFQSQFISSAVNSISTLSSTAALTKFAASSIMSVSAITSNALDVVLVGSTISSVTSVNAASSGNISSAITINSISSTSFNALIQHFSGSVISSVTNVSVAASNQSFATNTISSVTTVTVNAGGSVSGSANINSVTSLSTTGSHISMGGSSIDSVSSLTASSSATKLPTVIINSVSTVTSVSTLSRFSVATINSQSSLTANTIIARFGNSTISAVTSVVAGGSLPSTGAVQINAMASVSAAGAVIRQVGTTISSETLISVSGRTTSFGSSEINSITTLDVSSQVFFPAFCSINAVSKLIISNGITDGIYLTVEVDDNTLDFTARSIPGPGMIRNAPYHQSTFTNGVMS